jgi:hypothetical protein
MSISLRASILYAMDPLYLIASWKFPVTNTFAMNTDRSLHLYEEEMEVARELSDCRVSQGSTHYGRRTIINE